MENKESVKKSLPQKKNTTTKNRNNKKKSKDSSVLIKKLLTIINQMQYSKKITSIKSGRVLKKRKIVITYLNPNKKHAIKKIINHKNNKTNEENNRSFINKNSKSNLINHKSNKANEMKANNQSFINKNSKLSEKKDK